MDETDKKIINRLQQGFPICDRPYLKIADELGIHEDTLIKRIRRLLEKNILTRFGPMYDAEQFGGAFTLAAMQVESDNVEKISTIINSYTEVAHNYLRTHKLNLWFVIATETKEEIKEVIQRIELQTGHRVYNMPKQEEFYVGLSLPI